MVVVEVHLQTELDLKLWKLSRGMHYAALFRLLIVSTRRYRAT
jgi:hypothetical protein